MFTEFSTGLWHSLCSFLSVDCQFLENWAKDLKGISSKMTKKEFSIFIAFSDTHTCSMLCRNFE